MAVYNLKKIDFDQLLSLINTNNPYLKIYGGFGMNKKALYIKSITRLHNYSLKITKEFDFNLIDKYKGRFVIISKNKAQESTTKSSTNESKYSVVNYLINQSKSKPINPK